MHRDRKDEGMDAQACRMKDEGGEREGEGEGMGEGKGERRGDGGGRGRREKGEERRVTDEEGERVGRTWLLAIEWREFA